jgi:cytochrome c2
MHTRYKSVILDLSLALALVACGAPAQNQPTAVAALATRRAQAPSVSTIITTSFPLTPIATEAAHGDDHDHTNTATQAAHADTHAAATQAVHTNDHGDGMAGMDMSGMTAENTPPPGSDPARGKVLFEQGTGNPAVPTCITCHYADKNEVKVGPSLAGIGVHGAMHAQEEGEDLVTFLHSSIVDPNEHIMTDSTHVFGANGVSMMYQNYGKDLTEQQINDLIAYLMTLK